MSSVVEMYISQGIHGLVYGMLLFLVSSGLTLIFGMMGILNLAHASFFMLGAYFCYAIVEITGNFWLALIIAPLVTAFFGVICERFLLRKVHAMGHVAELLLTLGISLVILEAVKVFGGTESLIVNVPQSLSGLVNIGGFEYPLYRLFIIVMALITLVLMASVLFKTRLGMIVRASVTNPEMVNALGINTQVVFMLVFGIGTWLAGVGGVCAAPMLTVFPGMADQIGMDCFIVVMTGGLGSLIGAFISALAIGELNAYGVQFIPRLVPVLTLSFMVIVLAIKPTGLFGKKESR
jgi:branched-chain amino acid transport system permease protein